MLCLAYCTCMYTYWCENACMHNACSTHLILLVLLIGTSVIWILHSSCWDTKNYSGFFIGAYFQLLVYCYHSYCIGGNYINDRCMRCWKCDFACVNFVQLNLPQLLNSCIYIHSIIYIITIVTDYGQSHWSYNIYMCNVMLLGMAGELPKST